MNQKKPTTIFELLDYEQFRKRPAMFIGEKSISKLMLFINGYWMCEDFNQIESKDTRPPYWLFLKSICKYYNHNGSYYNWDGIILQNCGNNEEKAFETFLDRFDEFRTYKPIKIIFSKISKRELAFFHSHKGFRWTVQEGELKKGQPANTLYIIEYDRGFGVTIHQRRDEKQFSSDYELNIEAAKNKAIREYGSQLQWIEISEKEINETYEIINEK